jgi:hypothetical protein
MSVEGSHSYVQAFVLRPYGKINLPTQNEGPMKFLGGSGLFQDEFILSSYIVGLEWLLRQQWYDTPFTNPMKSCDNQCSYQMSTHTRQPGMTTNILT